MLRPERESMPVENPVNRTTKSMILLGVLMATALLAGCADSSEIVTFTDEHGRACTVILVIDREAYRAAGRQASGIDCDYPPAGQSPGPATAKPLPG
jgi:hypothetical protein